MHVSSTCSRYNDHTRIDVVRYPFEALPKLQPEPCIHSISFRWPVDLDVENVYCWLGNQHGFKVIVHDHRCVCCCAKLYTTLRLGDSAYLRVGTLVDWGNIGLQKYVIALQNHRRAMKHRDGMEHSSGVEILYSCMQTLRLVLQRCVACMLKCNIPLNVLLKSRIQHPRQHSCTARCTSKYEYPLSKTDHCNRFAATHLGSLLQD